MRHIYVLMVYQEWTCVSCIMHASARPAHALPAWPEAAPDMQAACRAARHALPVFLRLAQAGSSLRVARLACCSSRRFVCAGCIEPACLPVRQSSCGGYAGRTAAADSQRLFWAVVPCRLAVYSVRIHVDGVVSVRTARQAPGNCLCSLQKGPEGAGPASAPQ